MITAAINSEPHFPHVTVIVLNWNGAEDTIKCLDSLSRQTYKNVDVYLVDNGSQIDDRRRLEAAVKNTEVRLHINETNLGFTKGNNVAIADILKEGRSIYVALLNNDTIAHEDWLSWLVRCAEETGASMVASKMLKMDDPAIIDNVGHYMLNTGEILPEGNQARSDDLRYSIRSEVLGPCAGAGLYSVNMLKHVGLFDEFFETGYEDAELGVRGCILGYKCVYEPNAVVKHKGSVSVNKIKNFSYAVKLVVNIWYTHYKLMPAFVLLMNLPFIVFKLIVVCLGSLVLWRPRVFMVHLVGLRWVVSSEGRQFIAARSTFQKAYAPIKSNIIRKQRFFLLTYLIYIKRFVINGEKSAFE